MPHRSLVLALPLLGAIYAPALADGLIYQLPADGAWVKFEMTAQMGAPAKVKMTATLRVASVGRGTEKGEPCRWIEIRLDPKNVDGGVTPDPEIVKALVPEKHLKKGGDPVAHVIRAWTRRGDRTPRPLDGVADPKPSPLLVVLAGPLQDVKDLKAAEVESKIGKLPCAGLTGRLDLKDSVGETAKATVETRLHEKAPFGVVGSTWNLEGKNLEGKAETVTLELKLADFGEGATSELPDNTY